jgi:hypothetical protein
MLAGSSQVTRPRAAEAVLAEWQGGSVRRVSGDTANCQGNRI